MSNEPAAGAFEIYLAESNAAGTPRISPAAPNLGNEEIPDEEIAQGAGTVIQDEWIPEGAAEVPGGDDALELAPNANPAGIGIPKTGGPLPAETIPMAGLIVLSGILAFGVSSKRGKK
jgi:hypothetical protein